MLKKALVLVLLLTIAGAEASQAQVSQWFNQRHPVDTMMKFTKPFFKPAPKLSPGRVVGVAGGSAVIFSSAVLLLNEYWYKGYPRSKFHFFNDGGEWQGMDKVGHVFNSYYESRWSIGLYRWAGVKELPAILVGGFNGTFLMLSIEVMDGLSSQWGFSWYDIGANVSGSLIAIAQELAWREQRISIKISAAPQNYPADVKARATSLYGTTAFELFLKDYNAITIWASASLGSFAKHNSHVPKWLCVSVGYGANGLYGAYNNKWEDKQGVYHDRSDIKRYSQVYVSLDIDFTKIKTKSPALKALFNMLNMVKVPFPTFEFNPIDKVKFHPLFF